jgi:large subunit ribosomal protein L17
MRHGKKVAKLGRTHSHRKAMLANMVTSLFQSEAIHTTDTRAKELRRTADHLITFAKRGDLTARRQVLRVIADKKVVTKLFDEIGPRYASRNGGYTRIIKMGPRRGDGAVMCMIELVDRRAGTSGPAPKAAAAAEATKPGKASEAAGSPA